MSKLVISNRTDRPDDEIERLVLLGVGDLLLHEQTIVDATDRSRGEDPPSATKGGSVSRCYGRER